jgi:DNA-binding NtrC family response regulator
MKKDVTELKKMFVEILQHPNANTHAFTTDMLMRDTNQSTPEFSAIPASPMMNGNNVPAMLVPHDDIHDHEEVEESLNIMDKEKELIEKALKKHKGKRKDASMDLGISERTLYRKLKEYDIED